MSITGCNRFFRGEESNHRGGEQLLYNGCKNIMRTCIVRVKVERF